MYGVKTLFQKCFVVPYLAVWRGGSGSGCVWGSCAAARSGRGHKTHLHEIGQDFIPHARVYVLCFCLLCTLAFDLFLFLFTVDFHLLTSCWNMLRCSY